MRTRRGIALNSKKEEMTYLLGKSQTQGPAQHADLSGDQVSSCGLCPKSRF